MTDEISDDYKKSYYEYPQGRKCCSSCMIISAKEPFPHLPDCRNARLEAAEALLRALTQADDAGHMSAGVYCDESTEYCQYCEAEWPYELQSDGKWGNTVKHTDECPIVQARKHLSAGS